MLEELKVNNYALIQDLYIRFGGKLNIITGETGTGKSILLGALSLIIGNRADTSVLYDKKRKCVVEGTFNIKDYGLESFYENNGLDYDNDTIIRREISPSGKSRAFINDTPVKLNVLKALGTQLVDIHSQNQTLKLNDPGFQLALLDNFAGNQNLINEYQATYFRYLKTSEKLNDLTEQEKQSRKTLDYYQYQLNEIEEANFHEEEENELQEEWETLSHAEKIKQHLEHVNHLLFDGEYSIQSQLAEVKKLLQPISGYNQKLESLYQRIDSLEIEIKDIVNDAIQFNDEVIVDDERLENVSERLELMNRLLNKHRLSSLSGLIQLGNELKNNINQISSLEDKIQKLDHEKNQLTQKLEQLAQTLSKNRKAKAPTVEAKLTTLLQSLGIPQARINIHLEKTEEFNPSGKDKITILFSANKGTSLSPVQRVASGGELSRLMLGFKYLMVDSIFLPTIIFDEIDLGVSGEIAIKMGKMIQQLSHSHQVIAITHLPQVAASGDDHYAVYKKEVKDHTYSYITKLKATERIEELAKMLSGEQPSKVARQNARELIKLNSNN